MILTDRCQISASQENIQNNPMEDNHHHIENDEQYIGLTVNSGVKQPPIVNPYLKPRRRKPMPTSGELVEGILKGDVTTLSRAVTLVESLSAEHQAIAQEVIEKCLPYSGNSRRIGITGVPGAGKSTSIDVFGLHILKDGGKLAVLANRSFKRTHQRLHTWRQDTHGKTCRTSISIHSPQSISRQSGRSGA